MKPEYSIVVPCYNHLDSTKNCITSIINNSFPYDYELIVVANGCTDGTENYILSIDNNDFHLDNVTSKIVLCSYKEPLGGGEAINVGMRLSRGEYIIVLNNDTRVLGRDWIELLREPFRKDEKMGITGPLKLFTSDINDEFIVFFCAMIPRTILKTIGYLDTNLFETGYGEDVDFCMKAKRLGFKIKQVPSDNLTADGKMNVGGFPIFHSGEVTVHDKSLVPDWDEIRDKNRTILRGKYLKTFKVDEIVWRHPFEGWKVFQKPSELVMLSDFLKGNNIKKVFEIGSANGGTAVYWANMIGDDGVVYSIDIAPAYKCYRGTEYEKQIIEIIGDSHDPSVMHQFAEKSFDMLFIDGDHSYEGVKDDFYSFFPLVREKGFIVLHDIVDSEYHRERGCFVAAFWNEIKDRYKTFEFIDTRETPEVHTPVLSMGIGVIIKDV